MPLEPLCTITFRTPEPRGRCRRRHRGTQLPVGRGALHRAPLGPLPCGHLPSQAGRRGAGARVPRGEVPDRVLWEEPGDNYEEYIEAAKRLEGEGLVESGTSDYATLRATEKGTKAIRGFRE